MPIDPTAYMAGAIPTGSWVPGGQRNGTSLSDRETLSSQAPTSGGLHVNPLIGRGAAEINSGAGMMSPLMMGRMAAFGGGGGSGMTGGPMQRPNQGMSMSSRTRSQPNLYIPTGTSRNAPSQNTQGHTQQPSHNLAHSLAHRQMAAASAPRSPLAQSYVAPRSAREDPGYFGKTHVTRMSAPNPTRASHSVPTTPVYDGWAQEAISHSAHAPSKQGTSVMSYDPPSSASGEHDHVIHHVGSRERAQLRNVREHSRSRSHSQGRGRTREHQGKTSDPDDWESNSGAPSNVSPQPVYHKIHRDKAESLPAPPVPTSKVYDDRQNLSHQPRPPSALRAQSSRSVDKVVRIGSIPEGRPAVQSQGDLGAGDSVPLPLSRGSRPGMSRRHTSHPQQVPLPPSPATPPYHADVPSPSPSAYSHAARGRSRSSRIPRSMSHDALDMYGLADDLPPLSPLRSASQVPGPVPSQQGRAGGYVPPLADDEYDRYSAHPAAATPSSPLYALQGEMSGSEYGGSHHLRGRSPIMAPSAYGAGLAVPSVARHLHAGSMSSTMTASPAAPQTPSDLPLMGSDYAPLGFPKPTRAIAWNRDGPTMKSPGVAWHRDAPPDVPMSPAPEGPSWQQARPPNYGPIVPDRASSHSSGWWEAASRV